LADVEETMNQVTSTLERSAEQAPFQQLRVLVMEDNAMIGMLIADLLTEMGHVVCAVEASQEEAVAAAVRYRPQLLIVDAALRGGSGMSAVDEILRDGFIPHVFVSGDSESILAEKPGAIVLQKPFLIRELARAVQRACHTADGH
jgi:CheY-like chemotaxis protein